MKKKPSPPNRPASKPAPGAGEKATKGKRADPAHPKPAAKRTKSEALRHGRGRAPAKATPPADPVLAELTPLEQRFVDEYLIDLCGVDAYIRARPGLKRSSATVNASRLLGKPHILAAIERRKADRTTRLEVTQDEVLRRYHDILTADPRKLVAYKRVACRHCYGPGFRRQRTPEEMRRDRAEHAIAESMAQGAYPKFDEEGGDAYDGRKPPNDACPECFGDGVGRMLVGDTSKLSGPELSLYAGVKVGKDGLEVKLHDQVDALLQIARHTNFFEKDNAPPEAAPVSVAVLEEVYSRGMQKAMEMSAKVAGRSSRLDSADASKSAGSKG